MFKLHRTLIAAAMLVAATTTSQAAGITGTLYFTFTTPISITPSNFNAGNLTITGATAGQKSVAPSSTNAYASVTTVSAATSPLIAPGSGPYSLTVNGLTGTVNPNATFTSTSISIAPGAGADNVQIVLIGTIGTGADLNTALLTLSFQRNPNDPNLGILGTGILTSPIVPEPSSIALAGIGMAAAGLFSLRKRLAK